MKQHVRFWSAFAFVLTLVLLTLHPTPQAVQAQTGLGLTKTINGGITNVDRGQQIEYRVTFACNSLTVPCGTLTVTDFLPPNVTFVRVESAPGYTGVFIPQPNVACTNPNNTGCVVITNPNFQDGSQSEALIVVRVNNDAPPGAVLDNNVTGTITNPAETRTVGPINVTVNSPDERWDVSKVRVAPLISPTTDGTATYQLRLCPQAVDNITLDAARLLDTFPAGATIVTSGTTPGFTTPTANQIEWAIGAPELLAALQTATCITRQVTLLYPDTAFNIGDPIDDTLNGFGTPSGAPGEIGIGTDTFPDTLINAQPNPDTIKTVSGSPVAHPGGTGRFFLNLNTANANVQIDDVILRDDIPAEAQVTSIQTGLWSPVTVRATVQYFSTAFGLTTLGVVDGDDNTTFSALPTDITFVQWIFEYDDPGPPPAVIPGIPLGFSTAGGTDNPEIVFIPRVPPGVADNSTDYTNCATVTYTGGLGSVNDCEVFRISTNTTNIQPSKARVDSGPTLLAPGDTIQFEMQLRFTERATSALINPRIVDDLPPELAFVSFDSVSYSANIPGPIPAPTTSVAGQRVTWDWAAWTLNAPPSGTGDYVITVRFTAMVVAGTLPNTYTNTAYFTTTATAPLCESGSFTEAGAGGDLNGDGDALDTICRSQLDFEVRQALVIDSQKWIDSPNFAGSGTPQEFYNTVSGLYGDNCPVDAANAPGFTRFPCVAQGFPDNPTVTDDDFIYRLVVTNSGNVPGRSYILYDVLPFVGDAGSGGPLSGTSRGSVFQPFMTGAITILNAGTINPANIVIEYSAHGSTASTSCRREVFDTTFTAYYAGATNNLPAGCVNDWSTTPPSGDFTLVRSFRIRFLNDAVQFPQGDTLVFSVPMRIPSTAQGGQIAWNSFAQRAINALPGGSDLPTSEPRKVGIIVPERYSIGNRVWLDPNRNGLVDAADDQNAGLPGIQAAPSAPVRVELYRDDGDSTFDPGDTFIGFDNTDADGYYLFSDLDVGNYFVFIPASNFNAAAPLNLYRSTTTDVGGGDGIDLNDNGVDVPTPISTGVVSAMVTLSNRAEVTNDDDLSNNLGPAPTGDGPSGRGVRGERDDNSDLTVDFGFYLPLSLGSRVWNDEAGGPGDPLRNNGVRDPLEPGVNGVRVELYLDSNGNGNPDPGELVAFELTVNGGPGFGDGYYLFDGLGEGDYIVVIPASNFDNPADPLFNFASSVNAVAPTDATPDDNDSGIDNPNFGVQGIRSPVIQLRLNGEPLTEPDPHPEVNGLNDEQDRNSDLTVDFGFYEPRMSLGNRVWFDANNNQLDGDDAAYLTALGVVPPANLGLPNVRVNLYRDANGNNQIDDSNANGQIDPGDAEFVTFELTDANGYYLFDNLRRGVYRVELDAGNFDTPGDPAFNLISSTDVVVPADDATDLNDNGIDTVPPGTTPATHGILSPLITLSIQQEPAGETDLSSNPADGPNFRGNFDERDIDSNLTVDFGLYQPMSLGNRVWLDDGAGSPTFRAFYNDGLLNGTEAGINGVRVELYRDNNGSGTPDAGEFVTFDTTSNGGYYLFDGLPQGNYLVVVAASNFGAGGPLQNLVSSFDAAAPADSDPDRDDHGIDLATPLGISSPVIPLRHAAEPFGAADGDLSGRPADGPAGRGVFGELDDFSDLTVDFGFVAPPGSIGNRVWQDTGTVANPLLGNNGVLDPGEVGINGVTVSLFLDADGNGVPDGAALETTFTSAGAAGDGYYLFGNLPPNRYIVGVNSSNFGPGNPLEDMGSSTDLVAPADADPDGDDHGRDQSSPLANDILSPSLDLRLPAAEVTGETDLSGRPGDGPNGRGTFGEADNRSDLTVDFGFFYAYSLGNRVWLDNGAGGGVNNDGLINGTETGIANVRVELYFDANANGVFNRGAGDTFLRFDTTDANGYYLFDGLVPGTYFVWVANTNFDTLGDPLFNLDSSDDVALVTPDFAYLADDGADSNDNGVDDSFPATNGVASRAIVLGPARDTEVTTETDFSSVPADGPAFIGNNNEQDENSDIGVDFGFTAPRFSLGNRVWLDVNNSGTIDAADGAAPGIASVQVYLYLDNGDGNFTGADTLVAQDVTDAGGYYLFESFNLQPGSPPMTAGGYFVVVDQLEFRSGGDLFNLFSSNPTPPFPSVRPDPGAPDNGTDNDDNGRYTNGDPARPATANPGVGGVISPLITLTKNQEPIVSTGTPVAPSVATETDFSGNPADGPTPGSRGTLGQVDSNSDLTVDFGFYRPYSLGNRVWFDTNDSGTIDGAETGIPGVLLNLYTDRNGTGTIDDSNGNGRLDPADADFVQTDTTDASGYYLFDNLTPGIYLVQVDASNFVGAGALAGRASSTDAAGTPFLPDDGADNNDNGIDDPTPDVNGINSRTITLALGTETTLENDFSNNPADGANFRGTNGETNDNSDIAVDFGFVAPQMSLGNRVWLDIDNSGALDAPDDQNAGLPGIQAGIANVRVSLYRDTNSDGLPDGAAIRTTTTDASGYYLFDNLTQGNYVVGLDNSNFNAGQPLNGLISSTGLQPADTDSRDNGVDALNAAFGLLSRTIVLVTDNEPLGEGDLGPGGTGVANDANSNLTVDFGLYPPMSLGNRVWFDANNSGVQDPAESGLGGVRVNLYRDANSNGVIDDSSGNGFIDPADAEFVRFDITDANGYYLFDGLGQGRYLAQVDAANFGVGQPLASMDSSSLPATNPDDAVDRNDNGINNALPADNTVRGVNSALITLQRNTELSGETDLSGVPADGPNSRGSNGEADANSNLTVDFGFFAGAMSLGNRIWIDDGAGGGTPRDGVRDPGELTVPAGVRVSLYLDTNLDGVPDGAAIRTTTTDASGYYLFDNLGPSSYVVGLDAGNFAPGGLLVGYSSSPGIGAADTDDLDNGVDNNNPPVLGILSRTVTLTLNGEPAGEPDTGGPGSGTATDPNSNLTVDFGLYRPMSIGNRVWFDPNDNALIDVTEVGIAGVRVELWQDTNASGTFDPPADTFIGFDITDGRGYYLFDNLFVGSYFVVVPAVNFNVGQPLNGYTSSTDIASTPTETADLNDNGVGTAPDPLNGIVSSVIVLTELGEPPSETDTSGNAGNDGPFFRGRFGEGDTDSNLTIDFGFRTAVMSLGNRIWRDDGTGGGTPNNGVRDGGEPGVGGVTVELFPDNDLNGQPDPGPALQTTTTDPNGYYLFDNLPPGNYVVRVAASSFQTGGALFGLVSSPGTGAADTDDLDNGVDNAAPGTNGILSRTVTLTPNGEPNGEGDLGPGGSGAASDLNSNLTVDFGFNVQVDRGDNPDTFGTTIAATGPSHVIVSTLFLGGTIDPDADGQPSVGADGDDLNGAAPDDEDGVVFPTFVAGTTVNVEVTVFNNTGATATVALWIDFSANGVFDPGERFTGTVPSAATPQIIQIPVVVPINADVTTGGSTYVRARVSTDPAFVANPPPTGAAPNGEVEDYRVTNIVPPGLSITKTDNRNSIVVGQSTTYTITITNSGASVTNRNFVDNPPTGSPNGFLPATITWTCAATGGALCVSGDPVNGATANGVGAINAFIDVPTNGRVVYTLTGTLNPAYNLPTVTNQGEVIPGVIAQDVNGVIFDPPQGVKTGVVLSGNRIRWTMTWFNTGGQQAATVSDTLQPGQTFLGNLSCTTPAGSTSTTTFCIYVPATNSVTWSGSIGTGAPNRVEIAFDVAVPGDGTYANAGTIDVGGRVATAASTVTIGNPPPGQPGIVPITITKSVSAPFTRPGAELLWTLTITNPTGTPADNVVVLDTLHPDLTLIDVITPQGTVIVNGQDLRLELGTIGPNSTLLITIRTRVSRTPSDIVIRNVALFDAPYAGNAEAQASLVSRLPDTGQTPWWHLPALLLLAVVAVVGGLMLLRRRPRPAG